MNKFIELTRAEEKVYVNINHLVYFTDTRDGVAVYLTPVGHNSYAAVMLVSESLAEVRDKILEASK